MSDIENDSENDRKEDEEIEKFMLKMNKAKVKEVAEVIPTTPAKKEKKPRKPRISEEQKAALELITKNHNGGTLRFATNEDGIFLNKEFISLILYIIEREQLWLARKTALWSAPILKTG